MNTIIFISPNCYRPASIRSAIVVLSKYVIDGLPNQRNDKRLDRQRGYLLSEKSNLLYVNFILTPQNIHQIPIGRHSL
jgi:hypothetical protein